MAALTGMWLHRNRDLPPPSRSPPVRVTRHGPIVLPETHPGVEANINGPSLVTGPYRLHESGALSLAASGFPTEVPRGVEVTSEIQAAAIVAEGYDAHFTPRIASPDVVVDLPALHRGRGIRHRPRRGAPLADAPMDVKW